MKKTKQKYIYQMQDKRGDEIMKVAVSSSGKDLNSQLDPRFGRCAYFLVIHPDDMSFEVFDNESSVLGGGAGIQSAQFLASKGVDAVITGNCGPNAVQTLSAAGVELFAGQTGTVKEVVERFKKGQLRTTSEATVDSHFGMAPGAGSGSGGGMGGSGGMRQGMGGGGSMSRGLKMSGNRSVGDKEEKKISVNQELENLKEQAERLNQQMKGILTRINDLEKI
jgi:predicted Fe-Mo cluster-binding NifX family protein